MAPVPNGRLIFNEVPEGYPIPGKTTVYDKTATIDLDSVALNGGLLVRTLVFSIDPSIRGRMRAAYTVGKPVFNFGLGRVLRSDDSDFKVGEIVEGVLDFEEYTVVKNTPDRRLRVIHNEVGLPLSLYVGIAGMPGKTAYYGWKGHSQAKKGEVAFVTTGAGPVGATVIQLAKQDGVKVIASAGSDEKVKWIKEELGADVAFNYKTTSTAEVLAKEGPIDIYWDHVGGETLDTALEYGNRGARFIECGMISVYNNGYKGAITNLAKIIYTEIQIIGYLVFGKLEPVYREEFEANFPKLIKDGKIKYTEDITRGLEHAGEAILAQQEGRNTGKSVVIVAEE